MSNSNISIEYRNVVDLKPYDQNARTHSKKQIRQIAESIKRFGFTNPILVSDDAAVIAGHGRLEAARLPARLPVVVATFGVQPAGMRRHR